MRHAVTTKAVLFTELSLCQTYSVLTRTVNEKRSNINETITEHAAAAAQRHSTSTHTVWVAYTLARL